MTPSCMLAILTCALTSEAAQWPVYRHDQALSAVSLAKGNIVQPQVKWQYYLGIPATRLASDGYRDPWKADLDGDGHPERLVLEGKSLRVTDLSGKLLWQHTIQDSPTAERTRICKVLPDRKGKQIVVFTNRMDDGQGRGYCFSFEKGAAHGQLVWSTAPLSGQHAPTLVIDDVDGDTLPEIVTAPHYRLQIFDGQTGGIKAEVDWKVGRNYGLLLTRPRLDGAHKDIFIVCDFVLHVDCIRFQDGRWQHVWGHRYYDENAPAPRGREQYLRVGPAPLTDVDGDGIDEMVYMLIDATNDDQWHLRVRDSQTGQLEADVKGIWLWSTADFNGDGVAELAYTPTDQKRPRTYCDLHIGRLSDATITDLAVLPNVRPVVTNASLPDTAHTIADEGRMDLLRADLDGDKRPELFVGLQSEQGRFSDRLQAVSLASGNTLETKWRLDRPGHRLNLTHAGPDAHGKLYLRVHDLTTRRWHTFDGQGQASGDGDLGQPGGFVSTPIVVDLDGNGAGEIVLQNAAGEVIALRPPKRPGEAPMTLWSVPGVAMNPQPGYTTNGALSPQAADLDGDGRPEVLLAAEDEQGLASLVCVNGSGKLVWRRSFPGCAWGGLQAGVNLWTFGRFTDRKQGLDVYVDIHRRAKGSSEGWVLRGDTGDVVWQKQGLLAKDYAMPFGGGLPAVADVNFDGIDDLLQASWTIYGAISGNTGQPLYPPAVLSRAEFFGKWIAYCSPTVADLDGDGKLDVYLNSASYARGGYASVRVNGAPLWAEFHGNDEGSDGFGPVGDFDADGKLEIGVPVLNGSLLCLNAADGTHKWRIRVPVTGDVIAGDINGDGVMELIFASRDGKLRAVSGKDGREIWSLAASGRPVIADVTGDGLVELLAVGYDGMLRVIGQAGP